MAVKDRSWLAFVFSFGKERMLLTILAVAKTE